MGCICTTSSKSKQTTIESLKFSEEFTPTADASKPHRWAPEDLTDEQIKSLKTEESSFLDLASEAYKKQRDLYEKIALNHMENYEKIYGKEKADWWLRPMSRSGSFWLNEEEDDEVDFELLQTYIASPSSVDFRSVFIETLTMDPADIMGKDLWNLCDILALVVFTFNKELVGVNQSLYRLTTRSSRAGQSIIVNPGQDSPLLDAFDSSVVLDSPADTANTPGTPAFRGDRTKSTEIFNAVHNVTDAQIEQAEQPLHELAEQQAPSDPAHSLTASEKFSEGSSTRLEQSQNNGGGNPRI